MVAITASKDKPHHNTTDAKDGKKCYETCHIVCCFVVEESIVEVISSITICLRKIEELHQLLVCVNRSN